MAVSQLETNELRLVRLALVIRVINTNYKLILDAQEIIEDSDDSVIIKDAENCLTVALEELNELSKKLKKVVYKIQHSQKQIN